MKKLLKWYYSLFNRREYEENANRLRYGTIEKSWSKVHKLDEGQVYLFLEGNTTDRIIQL